MPSRFQPTAFGVGLIAVLGALLVIGDARGNEPPGDSGILPLKVRFWADEIELTGALPDQKTANRLMIAIHHAQPGKAIWTEVVIDPSRTVNDLPSTPQLAGLLLEMALSTKDSSLSVTQDEVIVSGLTDSLVTHAAFESRLRSASDAHGRKAFRNRICLVHSEDLDPSLLARRPRAVLAFRPVESPFLEMAGAPYGPPLPPATLGSLAGRTASILGGQREMPEVDLPDPGDSLEGTEEISDPVSETIRKRILEPSRRIAFTANSYLVSATDYDSLDGVASRLKSHPAEWGKVIVRGFPDTEGRHTYNDWLSLSRARAVKRILVDAGISEDLLKLEVSGGNQNPKNLRSVGIWIPRLEEPEEDEPSGEGTEVALSALPVAETTGDADASPSLSNDNPDSPAINPAVPAAEDSPADL